MELLFKDINSFFFGFLFMSSEGSGSPEGGDIGPGSSPEGGNGGPGSSPEGGDGGPGSSPGGGNSDGDVPLDEGDVPDLHGLRATCTHDSYMTTNDVPLENRGDPCDFNPTYQGEGRPLASHPAFPPDGYPPVMCSTCHALICYDCANSMQVDSDASLGSSPSSDYPRGYWAYMEAAQRDNPYGEGPSGYNSSGGPAPEDSTSGDNPSRDSHPRDSPSTDTDNNI